MIQQLDNSFLCNSMRRNRGVSYLLFVLRIRIALGISTIRNLDLLSAFRSR